MDLLRHAPAIVLRSGVRLVAAVLCGLSTLAAAQVDDGRPLDAVQAAGGVTEHFWGLAYASGSTRLLYQEEHWVEERDGRQYRIVLYRCPAGPAFARKWVRGPVGGSAPDFLLVDQRDGYQEGVNRVGGRRQVHVRENAGAAVRSAVLPDLPGAIIDAGFDAYVRSHWSDLAGPMPPTLVFLVPSRLAFYDFRVASGGQPGQGGRPTRSIRLRLDAWYGFAAPSIDLTYSEADRRLLRFEGPGNIRDAAGNTPTVRIEFPASSRLPPPDAAAIEAAAATPLVARCPA